MNATRFPTTAQTSLIARDVTEMLSIARTAMLVHRDGLERAAGRDPGPPPPPLSIHELDRFDDLSAVHGIDPIAGAHVEGEAVPWRTCEMVTLAALHVVTHALVPSLGRDALSALRRG